MAEMADSSGDESSAAHRTFQVPELLEMIFLSLSIPDLLVKIPRVCKHWKETVDSSVNLQRALFFKPTTDTRIFQEEEEWYIEGSGLFWRHKIIANPFIASLTNEYFISCVDPSRMKKGVDRPEASWRRMLVTQPPEAEVDIHSPWCGCMPCYRFCYTGRMTERRQEGARMGEALARDATPTYQCLWSEVVGESAEEVVECLRRGLSYISPAFDWSEVVMEGTPPRKRRQKKMQI